MRAYLTRRMHLSWHIAWAAAGYIVGLAIVPLLRHDMQGPLWLVCAAALCITALRKQHIWLAAIAFSSGIMFGVWRGSVEHVALAGYQSFYGRTVQLSGQVAEDVSTTSRHEQRIRLMHISIGDRALRGSVWVSLTSNDVIRRSDYIAVTGTMKPGFGNMSASIPRARVTDIRSPPTPDYARRVRDWFADGIRAAISEPQAALGVGYLVGQKTSLPDSLSDQLKAVGLTHAVVASGYNLTILVGFARNSLLRRSKYLATVAATLMICCFMPVTGFNPSMTRAGLVTGLSLAAWYYGRVIHPFVLLPFAAAITLLINPSAIWGDIGWYLSFGSFAGLVIVSPLIRAYFWPDDDRQHTLRGVFLETTSAQLATTPITLHVFGQFPAYSILANMMVLPFIPLTMVLTFFSGLAGLLLPGPIAQLIGLPASSVLYYMTSVIGWIAGWPGALGTLTFSSRLLVLSYIGLCLSMLYMWRRTGHSFKSIQNPVIGDRI